MNKIVRRTAMRDYGKVAECVRSYLEAFGEIPNARVVSENTGLSKTAVVRYMRRMREEDLLIETAQTEGFVTEADGGVTVVLDKTLTPELIEEGFVRELVSKIQTMRKEAGFEVMDRITVYASGNDKIKEVMDKNSDSISRDVLADAIIYDETDGYVKDWKINGEVVTLAVKKS